MKEGSGTFQEFSKELKDFYRKKKGKALFYVFKCTGVEVEVEPPFFGVSSEAIYLETGLIYLKITNKVFTRKKPEIKNIDKKDFPLNLIFWELLKHIDLNELQNLLKDNKELKSELTRLIRYF